MTLILGSQFHKKLHQLGQHLASHQTPTVVITELPEFVEDVLMSYQDILLDVEVLTLSQFEKQLLSQKHIYTRRLMSTLELTYLVRRVLTTESLRCFKGDKVSYDLIKEIIATLKTLHKNGIDLNTSTSSQLVIDKCHDLKVIDDFITTNKPDNTYWCLEDIVADLMDETLILPDIYVIGDDYVNRKEIALFDRLAQLTHVSVLLTGDSPLVPLYHQKQITWDYDDNAYEHFIAHDLWNQQVVKVDHPVQVMNGGNIFKEALKVASHIKNCLATTEAHYRDFMILVNNQDYVDYFMYIFKTWKIPVEVDIETSFKYDISYKQIIKTLPTLTATTFNGIIDELSTLKLTSDYQEILDLMRFDDEITPLEFKDFLETVLANHLTHTAPHDAIKMANINYAFSVDAKHLYITGINESVMPAYIKEKGILSDADYQTLPAQPVTAIDLMILDKIKIMKVLLNQHRSLTLSYATHDMANKDMLPSSLYIRLRNVLSSQNIKSPLLAWKPELYLRGSQVPDDDVNVLVDIPYEQINKPVQIDASMRDRLGRGMSISRLETYNKCPFQYFIKYGLNVEAVKTDVMVNELGTLAHKLMEDCLDHPDQIEAVAKRHIEENLKDKLKDSPLNEFLINELLRNMKHNLQVANDYLSMGEFEVYGNEVEVSGNLGKIPLKGYVDRVDTYHDSIRVIDYKSGEKEVDPLIVAQGFNMQMLVYLEMLAQALKKEKGAFHYFSFKKRWIESQSTDVKKEFAVEEVYKLHRMTGYVIDDEDHDMILGNGNPELTIRAKLKKNGEPSGHYLTKEDYDHILKALLTQIDHIYESISSGLIPITPSKGLNTKVDQMVYPCTYCDYKTVCLFDVFYNENRKIIPEKVEGGEES